MEFLKNNQDIFAWSHKDMPGIDSAYICHELNINPIYPTVKQKPRCFSLEKNKEINDEVGRLLEIGVIEECNYSNWISNKVVVNKKNGKDSVINFINLNKACPKDSFSLPKID